MSSKRVQSNLLQQNCYIRERNPLCLLDVKHETPKTYIDQVEEVNPDGSRIEKLVEREYPITPEYVASFEESCNYKNDPQSAIANAPHRTNLGDVSSFQNISENDWSSVSEMISRAAEQYDAILATLKASKKEEEKEKKGNE